MRSPRAAPPRRSALLGAIALLLGLAGAAWADGQRVRLTLADGEVVEGRLADFGARTYALELPGGAVRRSPEARVRRVEVLDRAAGAVLAAAWRRARAAGALDAVLGERRFAVHERRSEPDSLVAPRRDVVDRDHLLRVALEVAPDGGPRLEVEVHTAGGGSVLLGLDGPRSERRVYAFTPGGLLREVRAASALGRRARDPAVAGRDALPEPVVALLLAPLAVAAGDVEHVPYRRLRLADGEPAARRDALRLLPGVEVGEAGELLRVAELTRARDGRRDAGGHEVSLRAADGHLVGLRYRGGEGDRVLEAVAEPVDAERFAALSAEWGLEPPPAPGAEPPPYPGPAPPGPVGRALARAMADEGRRARLTGERWFLWGPEAADARLVRLAGAWDGARLVLELGHDVPGKTTHAAYRYVFDRAGRLRSLSAHGDLHGGSQGDAVDAVVVGERLVGAARPPVPFDEEQLWRRLDAAWPADAVPALLAPFLLAALDDLPPDLVVTAAREADLLAAPLVVGARRLRVARRRVAPGAGTVRPIAGLALEPPPGAATCLLLTGEAAPLEDLLAVCWLDAAGALEVLEGAGPGGTPLWSPLRPVGGPGVAEDLTPAPGAGRAAAQARDAREAAAVAALRRVAAAQAAFVAAEGRPAAAVAALGEAGLLEGALAEGRAAGHRVALPASGPDRWLVLAWPEEAYLTGQGYYALDAAGRAGRSHQPIRFTADLALPEDVEPID